eukprot:UN31826
MSPTGKPTMKIQKRGAMQLNKHLPSKGKFNATSPIVSRPPSKNNIVSTPKNNIVSTPSPARSHTSHTPYSPLPHSPRYIYKDTPPTDISDNEKKQSSKRKRAEDEEYTPKFDQDDEDEDRMSMTESDEERLNNKVYSFRSNAKIPMACDGDFYLTSSKKLLLW